MSKRVEQTITLTEREGHWVAVHEPTEVGAQAKTREQALDELDEAVALHTNDATERLENEDEVLRDLGIEPEEIDADPDDPPAFMR